MTPDEIKKMMEIDKRLTVGIPVTVRWGYGLGFRAEGKGTIVKVYDKSVQVRLSEPVQYQPGKDGWPAGFVLKGIPRFGLFGNRWDYNGNSVWPA